MGDDFSVKEYLLGMEERITERLNGLGSKLELHTIESAADSENLKNLDDRLEKHIDNSRWVLGIFIGVATLILMTLPLFFHAN